MEHLGEKIKEKRKKERLSAADLAIKLGLSLANIYKWESGARPSNPDDYKKLTDWLNNSESGRKNEEPASKEDFFLNKYIKTLEDNNQFLQKMVETSLISIVETQQAQLSHQKALAWYQAHRASEGDPEKLIEELTRLNSKVAEFAGFRTEKDSVKRS